MIASLRASYLLNQAIKKGEIIRGRECELCGDSYDRYLKRYDDRFPIRTLGQVINGHHWRGYDYPYDVWWICVSCNRRLHRLHCNLSKDEARKAINSWKYREELNLANSLRG